MTSMTLKKKLVFFILGLSLASSLIFLLIDQLTLSRARGEQKAVFAEKVASRVSQIVENEKTRIATLCYDWAAWDAMYAYVEKPSREFEEESLPQGVVPASDLSLIMVLDRDQKVVFHQGYDQASRRYVRFKLRDAAPPCLWSCLARSFARPSLESFFAETVYGPLIVVSAPILHNDGKGPMNGRVVMGLPPEEHAGDSGYPQISQAQAPLYIVYGQDFEINLRTVQNIFFHILKEISPRIKKQAGRRNQKAKEWMAVFHALGEKIGMRTE